MFEKKDNAREGSHVFFAVEDKSYSNIIFGTITGIKGQDLGVNGILVNPVGLKNKLDQGKTGIRSREILENPTPENCILAFIYRVEYENYTGIVNLDKQRVTFIPPAIYAILEGWIREALPEFLNNVLSLPPGDERDENKRLLRIKMDKLYDKNLKRNLYAVCRSLKILT
ncbi:MAG: hypothetical protein R1F52_00325 [Candidatus Nitrosoabyssus spongiisocia]|nr:MAG: hypothetical protein R1F52_00325 [Nitrosopumilaceae archaeon AB1(1)]